MPRALVFSVPGFVLGLLVPFLLYVVPKGNAGIFDARFPHHIGKIVHPVVLVGFAAVFCLGVFRFVRKRDVLAAPVVCYVALFWYLWAVPRMHYLGLPVSAYRPVGGGLCDEWPLYRAGLYASLAVLLPLLGLSSFVILSKRPRHTLLKKSISAGNVGLVMGFAAWCYLYLSALASV